MWSRTHVPRIIHGKQNILTTNATARLLHSIVGKIAVSPQASEKMMNLLRKNLSQEDAKDGTKGQAIGFLDEGLSKKANLWSIGIVDIYVRHNFAYIELPNLQAYLLVIFTEGKEISRNERILPDISQNFVEAMKKFSPK